MEIRHYGQRTRVSKTCTGGRTIQSQRDECDINLILKRHAKTGEALPYSALAYGDFSNVQDYQSAMNSIIAAQASFDSLPARTRDRMRNDPAELIRFMDDPNNYDEAVTLGLINSPGKPAEQAAPAPTGDPVAPVGEASPVAGGD